MNFASDNTYGAHPAVMAALNDCNIGTMMGYGNDPVTARAETVIREVLEAPDAVVRFVATGTAANALVCAQLAPSFGRIYCHEDAHIEGSECAAPEFFSGGAKMLTLAGEAGKIAPETLAQALQRGVNSGLNGGPNRMISLTNATEWGTIYTPDEIAALVTVANGVPVHIDGARFANAVAASGCSAAEMSWRAGISALCLGGTKNGAMSAEAVVFFDADQARGFDYRRKQSGHVFSKQRFLAAQMLALVEDGLWLRVAGHANSMARYLADGIAAAGGALLAPVQSNAVFADIPVAAHQRAQAAGAIYYVWSDDDADTLDPVPIRCVTAWDTRAEDVDAFLKLLAG